jgi:hypothetical protein
MSGVHQASGAGEAERVPDLMLEKLALGELPEDRAAALRQRLGAEGEERLAAIERSNAEILREHPPGEVAAAVRQRLARLDGEAEAEASRRGSAGWLLWAPVMAGAAMALLWWVGRDGEPEGADGMRGAPVIAKAEAEVPPEKIGESPGPEQIYLKGDPRLLIDRMQDGRPTRMVTGDAVAAGDLLQVGYLANGVQQGVVVSIDGAGVATLHFPASEGASPLLEQGGRVGLPESYELDAAPGFERFFFVTVDGAEPVLEPAKVMEAARALAGSERARDGELVLPQGWRQQSVLLRK